MVLAPSHLADGSVLCSRRSRVAPLPCVLAEATAEAKKAEEKEHEAYEKPRDPGTDSVFCMLPDRCLAAGTWLALRACEAALPCDLSRFL